MSAQATVLLVDDDPAIRLLCRLNLELDGHIVTEAATLAEARTAVANGRFDLVILDVHVGGHDSRDLLAELRDRQPDMPVALLTGSASREELRETVERLARGRV